MDVCDVKLADKYNVQIWPGDWYWRKLLLYNNEIFYDGMDENN